MVDGKPSLTSRTWSQDACVVSSISCSSSLVLFGSRILAVCCGWSTVSFLAWACQHRSGTVIGGVP
ncbi:hypothetical protein RchiOBHm_Chr4g0388481 [Rosa chinensis]|uniref:Uncharacterized protein n=1 Tax=Rosa chinensis TaxID=74649 RepID=A0A2P6QPQ9_ROSCH|nr:hypothetical protein RchiOBHm_Chr4g0388481 [Rosa chinensis]